MPSASDVAIGAAGVGIGAKLAGIGAMVTGMGATAAFASNAERIGGLATAAMNRMNTMGISQGVAEAGGTFWNFTFAGQALSGKRSGLEIVSRMGGYTGEMGIGRQMVTEGGEYLGRATRGSANYMSKIHSSAAGTDIARNSLRNFFKPGAMARSGARAGGRAMKMMAAGTSIFLPFDIGMRMMMGESGYEASAKAVTGTVGSIVGAGIAGAIAGSVVPGLGTAAGFIGGIIGYGMGEAAGDTGLSFQRHLSDLGRNIGKTELGGQASAASMTRAAYTMRARSLQQINRSGINARSVLGREATIAHMR